MIIFNLLMGMLVGRARRRVRVVGVRLGGGIPGRARVVRADSGRGFRLIMWIVSFLVNLWVFGVTWVGFVFGAMTAVLGRSGMGPESVGSVAILYHV